MKAYKNNQETKNFNSGQELIWDSGYGFDVVVYKNESNLFNNSMINCKMKTGIKKGNVIPVSKKQVNVFSLEKWAEMRRKYDKVS